MQHKTWGSMPHSVQADDSLHSTDYIRVPKLFTGLESIIGKFCWFMGETRVESGGPDNHSKQPRAGLGLVIVLKDYRFL